MLVSERTGRLSLMLASQEVDLANSQGRRQLVDSTWSTTASGFGGLIRLVAGEDETEGDRSCQTGDDEPDQPTGRTGRPGGTGMNDLVDMCSSYSRPGRFAQVGEERRIRLLIPADTTNLRIPFGQG